MQILQWLFKVDQEKNAPVSSIAEEKEFAHHARDKKKDIVAYYNRNASSRSRKREKVNLDCKDLNKYLGSLLRRGNLQSVFHSSLYIYRVKIKREATGPGRNKLGSTDHVGNKVLPVSESESSSTCSTRRKKQNECRDNRGYSCDERKGEGRRKGVSRMKELLRWSEAAKSQKGQKHNNRRKGMQHTRQVESMRELAGGDGKYCARECLRCDGGGENTNSEECRKGNWITTDDEFVVLEL